jgi:hypothetical protein
MGVGSRSRLRQLQRQHSDQLLSVLTVLLLVMLFVVAPFQAVGIKIFDAFGVVVGMVMIAGVLIISASPAATAVMLVGFSLNIVVVTARLNQPLPYDLYLAAAGWFISVCTLGYVVARKVFSGGEVTLHRIVGAVLLYLLIALAFVSAFLLLGFWVPNAFSGLVVEDNQKLSSSLIYFSFVTLTTVGYGDIVPIHPVARSLCNLESIIGQLYPATLLARMVSLEIEARRR